MIIMELNIPFVNSFNQTLIAKFLQFCAVIAEFLPQKGRCASSLFYNQDQGRG